MQTLNNAANLDELLSAINAASEEARTASRDNDNEPDFALGRAMTKLPTFGGDEPSDTSGVWSWDDERLLVGACAPFRIVTRAEFEGRDDGDDEDSVVAAEAQAELDAEQEWLESTEDEREAKQALNTERLEGLDTHDGDPRRISEDLSRRGYTGPTFEVRNDGGLTVGWVSATEWRYA